MFEGRPSDPGPSYKSGTIQSGTIQSDPMMCFANGILKDHGSTLDDSAF